MKKVLLTLGVMCFSLIAVHISTAEIDLILQLVYGYLMKVKGLSLKIYRVKEMTAKSQGTVGRR